MAALVPAALASTSMTLLDIAKLTGPDGKILPRVNRMQQRNTLLQTMEWKMGNLDTGHRVSAISALPSVAWVRYNEGVPFSKGDTDTYDETTGMLMGLSSIDPNLAEINGNVAEVRAADADTQLAAMANALEGALFYETTATRPERILGLSPRLAATTSKYGNQILKADANAAGANQASIWLIGWGERTVYGISPRGQGTGLSMQDMGLVRTLDGSNVLYKYETLFKWKCGVCVEDYRYVTRIANVDIARLDGNAIATLTSDITNMIIKAYYQVFDPQAARFAWYTTRKVAAYLHLQATATKVSNSTLSIHPAPMLGSPGLFGAPIVHAMGWPVYVTDGLSNAEAVVA